MVVSHARSAVTEFEKMTHIVAPVQKEDDDEKTSCTNWQFVYVPQHPPHASSAASRVEKTARYARCVSRPPAAPLGFRLRVSNSLLQRPLPTVV